MFVRVSVIVTVAPAAVAPFESVIVPSSDPLTACPIPTVKTPAQINASNNSLFAICINNLLVGGCFLWIRLRPTADDPRERAVVQPRLSRGYSVFRFSRKRGENF